MLNLKKGENAVIKRLLKQRDGSDFARTEFTTLAVELIQSGQLIQSYAYPSTYLRAGTASNEIELEITTTISALFSSGNVVAKYTFAGSDAEFDGGVFTIIITEEILAVDALP